MMPKTANEEILGEGIRVRVTELEKKLLLQRCKTEGYVTLSGFCRAKLVKNRETRKKNCFSVLQKYLDKIEPQ